MNTLKFKTNINCTGCLSKVAPFLDKEKSIQKWNVDLESEDRILTVKTSNLDVEEVKNTVQKVGFKVETM